MDGEKLAQGAALAGLAACAAGLGLRWLRTRRRALPADGTVVKGDIGRGVRYAFTAGMMPWAKESTRRHAVAYLRGVGFHGGIFLGLAALALSPFWWGLPAVARLALTVLIGLGAALGAAGVAMRLVEGNLRRLSTADDFFSVVLVTAFLGVTALALVDTALVVPMYWVAGAMLAYIPLGKIRHCLYFFYSRLFFGRFVGRRGVLPHPAPLPARGS